jgi:nitroreductase
MAEPDATTADDDEMALAELALALIQSRQSVAPKRLKPPGPDAQQLRQLVEAAGTAPDHHGLAPWRLIRVLDHQRDALADLFEACARDRQPPPSADDLAKSRAKAYRAPVLLLAVLKRLPPDPEVPDLERAVALGGALMAILLAAHGLGYAGMLTSGRSVRTPRFAQGFGLGEGELAVCFVSLGTPDAQSPKRRPAAEAWLSDCPGINPQPGA